MIQELENRFAEEMTSYAVLKEQAEKACIKWRYSTGELWDFEPDRNGVLTTEELPGPDGANFGYGYDTEGRVTCIRKYSFDNRYKPRPDGGLDRISIQELSIEYFLRYENSTALISRFLSTRQQLQWIYRVVFENGKVVEKEQYGDGCYYHDRHVWEAGSIKLTQSLNGQGRVVLESTMENGQCKLYRIRRDGSRFLLGQPLPKGVTVKSLLEKIRQRLIEVIPQTVKSARIGEPIYCVALAYDGEGNDVLPSYLGLGLETERQHWLKEKGEEAPLFIWNPAEFKHYEKNHTQLRDDELEEACEYLNGELANRSSTAPATKLLIEVARELERFDWSGIIQTTPDFVVYAVDFELGDLQKNLKKIVEPEKLKGFKKAKLL